MTALLFIRHGQTDGNKQGIAYGQEVDGPLNEVGIAQVQAAAQALPAGIDEILSSPMKRALQTAEILNGNLGLPISTRDDLKELSYGRLGGMTWDEIAAETGDPDIRIKDTSSAYDYRAFGGESAEDVRVRVRGFIDFAKNEHSGKTVLITTHGGILEAAKSLYSPGEITEAVNAEVFRVEI
ncbi:MAG: histidine phosphatase family protein [bacterium]